jgi:alpha-galactosidase
MNYAMLSRHSLQSVSDQMDYRKLGVIAAAAPSVVTPEQSAIWSYPLSEGDKEEVIFNMVNSLLMRIHQSGNLEKISPERFELVKEGIEYYKTIRKYIGKALPFWPLGIPSLPNKGWMSLGLRTQDKVLLAIWRLESADDYCNISLPELKNKYLEVKCGYPIEHNCSYRWYSESGRLTVKLPGENTARLFELSL